MSYKPTNGKAYGSIPHLIGSKMGIGDKRISQGQHDFICKKKRKSDFVIIQEKLDGSCVAVYRQFDRLLPLTRSGYLAESSPYKQHHAFHDWVNLNKDRFLGLLNHGERVVGEWLLQPHGTKINLWHEPFVAFDIISSGKRLPYREFTKRISLEFITPFLFSYGESKTEEEILKFLDGVSYHGQEKIEGVICRVETNGEFNYVAKYVRHDFKPGVYMKNDSFNEGWEDYFIQVRSPRKIPASTKRTQEFKWIEKL